MNYTNNPALGPAFDLRNRANGCVAYDVDAKPPTYGYDPKLAPGVVFTIMFGFILIAQVSMTIRSRKWWYITFALGALGELMGWAARAAAHPCPYNKTLFSLQISILIILLCLYGAGIYYILEQLIAMWGRQYSLISPKLYLYVFITFDLLSIIIQGVGGGLASAAGSKVPPADTGPGTHTMMAGIIIQLVSMSLFAVLWLITLWKARHVTTSPALQTFLFMSSLSTAFILIRNFYRAVELSQGWTGYLITHEIYFCILDGMLMVLAVLCFTLFFPSRYVDSKWAKGVERPYASEMQEGRVADRSVQVDTA